MNEDILITKQWLIDTMKEPHILIVGTTGSGKSCLLHNCIDIIYWDDLSRIVLIDLKKVELYEFRHDKRVIAYADTIDKTITALKDVIGTMEARLKFLRWAGSKKQTDAPIYVLIDEYADLALSYKHIIEPLIIKITTLGRAANIHMIVCTQRPTADVLSKKIMVNLTARVCLRVACAQDSRNVIGRSGAELLPLYGKAFLWREGRVSLFHTPDPTNHEVIKKVRTKKYGFSPLWLALAFGLCIAFGVNPILIFFILFFGLIFVLFF